MKKMIMMALTLVATSAFAHDFRCNKKAELPDIMGHRYSPLDAMLSVITSYSLYGSMKVESIRIFSQQYDEVAGNETYDFSAEHYSEGFHNIQLRFVLDENKCDFVSGVVLHGTMTQPSGRVDDLTGMKLYKYTGNGH